MENKITIYYDDKPYIISKAIADKYSVENLQIIEDLSVLSSIIKAQLDYSFLNLKKDEKKT